MLIEKFEVKFVFYVYLAFISGERARFLAWQLQFVIILGSFAGPGFLYAVIHVKIFFCHFVFTIHQEGGH